MKRYITTKPTIAWRRSGTVPMGWSGINHVAHPAYMLLLAHSDSAWVYRAGLAK